MDDQASQGSFHLPSSMEDFSPSCPMEVTTQGSGAESDISMVAFSGHFLPSYFHPNSFFF